MILNASHTFGYAGEETCVWTRRAGGRKEGRSRKCYTSSRPAFIHCHHKMLSAVVHLKWNSLVRLTLVFVFDFIKLLNANICIFAHFILINPSCATVMDKIHKYHSLHNGEFQLSATNCNFSRTRHKKMAFYYIITLTFPMLLWVVKLNLTIESKKSPFYIL